MSYKKIIYTLILLLSSSCSYPYNITFIHIGKNIPEYLFDAVEQSRLFNPRCDIYVLANKNALNNSVRSHFSISKITIVELEALEKTKEHVDFLNTTCLNKESREGFWLYTSERFLYLNDFCQKYNLNNIIHLETDNMVYVDLNKLIPIFEKYYHGIGAVFDNDERCIPGFIYFSSAIYTQALAKYFANVASSGKNDMQVLGMFYHKYSEIINTLPIIMPEYVDDFELSSDSGHRTKEPSKYYNHIDKFESIFDGAAIGQYLGGIDPRNGPSKPSFINESCLFNPSRLSFEWINDKIGHRIPYALYKKRRVRINNLHIHSKNLKKFSSYTI